MDYEQKYKEALERANKYHFDGAKQCIIDTLEYIFPELKESEDERIRKWLICGMNALKEQKSETFATIPIDDAIAWLEKQGETYTKRDVDDAFVEGMALAKDELEKQGEKKSSDEVLKIRQELYQSGYNDGYKHGCEDTKKQGEQNLANSAKTCKKSQRMISAEAKEALYDKSAPIDIDKMVGAYANNEEFGKPLNCMIRAYKQGLNDAIGKVVSNPAWSEEDKNFMYDTLSNLTELKDRYGEGYGNVGKCIDWLKSLKQRIGG